MITSEMYEVLIVDDEQVEREGLKKLIEALKLPFYIHLATDGEVAYEYLRTHTNVDLLITDVQMSFKDGLSLIQLAHQLYPTLPVIIFSAYDKFDYAQKAIALDVSAYLLKPVEPDVFLQTMQKVLVLCQKNREHSTQESSPSPVPENEHPVVSLARSIIETEYNKDISLYYIAEKCNRTGAYVSSLFCQQTGVSITDYIKEFRMKKATELLTHTNLKIAEISTMVGYHNPNYFNKVFNSTYHVSPGDYRKGKLQ